MGETEAKVLGKCPHCGQNVLEGKYGAYCQGKCGMYFKKAFGIVLSQKQVQDMLSGKKTLVKGIISKRTGNPYDIYLTPDGYEEYSYTGADGKERTGYRFRFEREFPEGKVTEKKEASLEEQVDEMISKQGGAGSVSEETSETEENFEDSFMFS